MKNEMKSSISKLRSLREDLCKKQSSWKQAFEIKDQIVMELNLLKEFTDSTSSTKEQISEKIDCLLILLDPARENGEEDE
tara:strand:+ start:730 stop:969 length:240 start_codon:yes stop_codon:yes gene_type:complete